MQYSTTIVCEYSLTNNIFHLPAINYITTYFIIPLILTPLQYTNYLYLLFNFFLRNARIIVLVELGS